MRTGSMVLTLFAVATAFAHSGAAVADGLPTSASFSTIADPPARSRAIFAEVAKVLTGPRCMNCHPAGEHPLQGNDHHIHQPAAFRGPNDNGVPGLPCAACHSDRNFTLATG